jgi:nitrite reductase/ring-hydroxylating ferredoxin subunit
MDVPRREFVLAGSLEELKAKGRLVLHGGHRPILLIYDRGRAFALDNRCLPPWRSGDGRRSCWFKY